MSATRQHQCLPEGALAARGTGHLLEHMVASREASCERCTKLSMGILAYGYENLVHWKLRQIPEVDRADVAQTVLENALHSVFDGKSIGEFVNWLKTIARFRAADYWKAQGRKPPDEPLPDEHEGEEEFFTPIGAEEDEYERVRLIDAAGRVLDQLESPEHRMVIGLYGPGVLGCADLAAADVAERVNSVHAGADMTETNVHKIWSRFKAGLIAELGLEPS